MINYHDRSLSVCLSASLSLFHSDFVFESTMSMLLQHEYIRALQIVIIIIISLSLSLCLSFRDTNLQS